MASNLETFPGYKPSGAAWLGGAPPHLICVGEDGADRSLRHPLAKIASDRISRQPAESTLAGTFTNPAPLTSSDVPTDCPRAGFVAGLDADGSFAEGDSPAGLRR